MVSLYSLMADTDISRGAAAAKGGLSSSLSVSGLFGTVTNTLIFFIGAISVLMIVIGGLRYVISAGNPSAVNGAKNTILYAIVGLVLSIAAYAIANFVIGAFK